MKFFFISLVLVTKFAFAFSDVSVELQWEEIPDAKKYELEIQNKSGKVITVVKSDSAYFRFKIKPGKFVARCRALDSRGVPGEWSELTDLEVSSPKPKVANFDKPVSLTIPEGETSTELNLSWSKIDNSLGYEIEVKDAAGKITTHKLSEASFKLPISIGSYQYRIRALNPDSTETSDFTDWSKPITVSAPPLQAPQLSESPEKSDLLNTHSFLPKRVQSKQGAVLVINVAKRFHLSSEWLTLDPITSANGEIKTEGWSPGVYQLEFFFKKDGFPDSDKVKRLITIKPSEKELIKSLAGE